MISPDEITVRDMILNAPAPAVGTEYWIDNAVRNLGEFGIVRRRVTASYPGTPTDIARYDDEWIPGGLPCRAWKGVSEPTEFGKATAKFCAPVLTHLPAAICNPAATRQDLLKRMIELITGIAGGDSYYQDHLDTVRNELASLTPES